MKVVPVSEAEAIAALPETFDDTNDPEMTAEEVERAAQLLLAAFAEHPDEHFFKIVLDPVKS